MGKIELNNGLIVKCKVFSKTEHEKLIKKGVCGIINIFLGECKMNCVKS
jgi:hypothetical protein